MRTQDLTTPAYWNNEWAGAGSAPRQRRVAGRVRGRRHPLPGVIAQLLRNRLPDPVDVLEVGCAPGLMLAQFHCCRPHDRLHGVDFAGDGLQQAKQFFRNERLDVTLHQSDVRCFEPARDYGVVYSCGLIEHFSDPSDILAHHVRLCAPGGTVAVAVPNYVGRVQQWFIQRLDPSALEAHNLQTMNRARLAEHLQAAGLRDVVVGASGPALIRSHAARRSLRTQLLRRVAQTWNLGAALVPVLAPWRSVVWAYGRKT